MSLSSALSICFSACPKPRPDPHRPKRHGAEGVPSLIEEEPPELVVGTVHFIERAYPRSLSKQRLLSEFYVGHRKLFVPERELVQVQRRGCAE